VRRRSRQRTTQTMVRFHVPTPNSALLPQPTLQPRRRKFSRVLTAHDATWLPADAEVQNAATDGISCVAWSPVANHLAAGSWDNQIRCWEIQQNGSAVPKAAISHDGPILCASWANDGSKVYTGSCDKTAKIWDLATSQATQVAAHDQPIKNIFWVQEMGCVVTSSWDKTVK
jgi:WD40 repeat protein